MPNGSLRLCLGCMNYVNAEEAICNICGTNRYEENNADELKRGYLLDNRFLVGKAIKRNGEHIIYIAKDNDENKLYFIKEYAPQIISTRSKSGEVIAKLSYEVKHKTFMVDFLDLHQTLKQFNSTEGLLPIEDIIVKNKTVYIIYKYKHLTPLQKYVESNGNFDWNSCRDWIFKLNGLLITLHKNGVIHRGISPQTLYFDDNNNLVLWDFLIPCFRTKTTQLNYELFESFSAPEQYFLNKWQGEWTDVYSTASVLVYILTGHKLEALRKDFFEETNFKTPKNVLNTLKEALNSDYHKRIQTIRQFNIGLLDEEQETSRCIDKTMIFDLNDTKKQAPETNAVKTVVEQQDNGVLEIKGIFKTLVFIGLGVVLVGAIVAGVLYFINKNSQQAPQKLEVSTVEQAVYKAQKQVERVPNFVGEVYEEVCKQNNGKFKIEAEMVFDEIVPEGVIISQTPKSGTQYEEDRLLHFKFVVSKGVEKALMPDVLSLNIADAEQKLNELQIKYDKIFVETDEVEPNIVFKTSKEAGEEVKINKEKVMLYLKKI
ncbi:MAG: PASTA domain-containing protein [Oscillospiraceae bacterium]|nr:PASTA domain-containing protein [Oscillospiraceae bacterium]